MDNYVRNRLPIDAHKDKIIDLIGKNDVTIISSSTGSGKTTRIPQFLLQCRPQIIRDLRIVVTQPRRISAVKNCERVARELNVTVGSENIGYQISNDVQSQYNTRLTFMTTEVLVQQLINNNIKYNMIIIDEVHVLDVQTVLLLLLVKLLLSTTNFITKPKVILLSATMNYTKFKNYFERFKVGLYILEDNNRVFSLQTYYLEDLHQSTPEGIQVENFPRPEANATAEENEELYSKICQLMMQFPILDEDNVLGAVLIFVPGFGDICTLGASLRAFAKSFDCNWEVLEMYSRMNEDDTLALFRKVETGRRKLIISTNISESSITIPDIEYVIDLGLTKHLLFDKSTGFASLQVCSTSQNECIQRAGRAGRTSKGFCFRLMSKDYYNQLSEEAPSEVTRIGLGLTFLQLKNLNFSNPSRLLMQCIEFPSKNAIVQSVPSLKESGCLSINMPNGDYIDTDGELTSIGKIATILNCDPKQARVIAFGKMFDLLNESIIIAMSMGQKSIFASFTGRQLKDSIDAFIGKMEFSDGCKSDALSNLGAYQFYLLHKKNPNWMSLMKVKFLKSAELRNLEYSVNRAEKKLDYFFKKYIYRPLYLMHQISESPKLKMAFQILLFASAFPSIFYRNPVVNHTDFVKRVEYEIQNCNPYTTIFLTAKHPINELTDEQTAEIRNQLAFTTPPSITLHNGTVICQYEPNPANADDWIGRIAKDVYKGLRMKNMAVFIEITAKDGSKIGFDGPTSSIGIKCKPLFCDMKKQKKQFVVARNSVNSFIVDDYFPEKSSYVLASLEINSKPDKLVAHESTLMSPMNGLLDILSLIFASSVQLRTTSNDQHLWDGLFGMGNSLNTVHDINMIFGVKISHEDIKDIREIRRELNKLLSVDYFRLLDGSTKDAGRVLMDNIIKLLRKNRPHLEYRPRKHMYWKVVNNTNLGTNSLLFKDFVYI